MKKIGIMIIFKTRSLWNMLNDVCTIRVSSCEDVFSLLLSFFYFKKRKLKKRTPQNEMMREERESVCIFKKEYFRSLFVSHSVYKWKKSPLSPYCNYYLLHKEIFDTKDLTLYCTRNRRENNCVGFQYHSLV